MIRFHFKKSLQYMGFNEGDAIIGKLIDYVFWEVVQMAELKISGIYKLCKRKEKGR